MNIDSDVQRHGSEWSEGYNGNVLLYCSYAQQKKWYA